MRPDPSPDPGTSASVQARPQARLQARPVEVRRVLLFLGEMPDPLVGPQPTGLIGSAGWVLAAVYLLWRLGRSGTGRDGKW